jgi:hypothetical protein
MNTENISTYEEFCAAAHEELAAIARANVGRARAGWSRWDDVADASATGILLSLGKAVRLPDVEEWPGVAQIDYEPIPDLENRIGRDILDRDGPFKYETNPAVAESLRSTDKPVNFPISAQGRATIRAKIAEYIKLAKWRFHSEQQVLAA